MNTDSAWAEYMATVHTDPERVRIADHGTALERMRLRFDDGYSFGHRDGSKQRVAADLTMRVAVDLTMRWDETHWFPFIEDDNGNITGPGHQDKAAFARLVNQYDDVCNGAPPDPADRWIADDVAHGWITFDPANDERFIVADVTASTPGAIPVTTMWGVR